MSCNCSRFIDIRGRCLPDRNRKEWNRCKSKVDTVYWLKSTERDIYDLIEEYRFNTDALKYVRQLKKSFILLIKIGVI
jgi:hypothetical protein